MRPDRFHEEESSDDSFLDVIANVVGVLIILVMLVGLRAARNVAAEDVAAEESEPTVARQQEAPTIQETPVATTIEVAATKEDLEQLRLQLDEAQRIAKSSQQQIEETTARIVKINLESTTHDRRRVELAMHRSVLEKELEQRRDKLDSNRKREFDVQRQMVEAQLELDEMTKEQLTLATARPTVEEVECVPTPLAKTVEDEAIHLRIHKGLVSIVPLEELLQHVQNNAEELRRRLQTRDEVIETFGPLDGYRLRFTINKRNASGAIGGPRAGQVQRTVHDWNAYALPVADKLGNKVEQALLPGAELYERLNSKRRQPTVVVWLYTDSFNEYRPLKRALWEMGAEVAVRPMRPGTHIGASPHGTKSSAQ